MKRLFFSFLIFCISMDASAATVLKPSLNAQMQKQSIQDRKAKNATRLVELRNHRATQSKTTIVSNTTKSTKTGAIIASSTTTTKTVTNTPSPVIFLSSQPPIS